MTFPRKMNSRFLGSGPFIIILPGHAAKGLGNPSMPQG